MTEIEIKKRKLDCSLIRAIVRGNAKKAFKLLEDGANPMSYDSTPIKAAINNDRLDVLKLILENKSTIHALQSNLAIDFLLCFCITIKTREKQCNS